MKQQLIRCAQVEESQNGREEPNEVTEDGETETDEQDKRKRPRKEE